MIFLFVFSVFVFTVVFCLYYEVGIPGPALNFCIMSLSSPNISKVDNLVICSLNFRGLSNDVKRRETFNRLRNKKYSFYFLQAVHSSKETEKLWLAESGYRGLFSSLSSSRAGNPSYLTTTSLLKYKNTFQIPREDSSQLISKLKTKL